MSRAAWIHGEGRLGEGPAGPGQTCWRCGEVPPAASPCTEKRGDGPPWRHDFQDRATFHPWRDYVYAELMELGRYLQGKSLSSLATARAFDALVTYGERIGFSAGARQSHVFARALYADKAAKRIRLLDWVMDELEERAPEQEYLP